jgi:hypothetical protein
MQELGFRKHCRKLEVSVPSTLLQLWPTGFAMSTADRRPGSHWVVVIVVLQWLLVLGIQWSSFQTCCSYVSLLFFFWSDSIGVVIRSDLKDERTRQNRWQRCLKERRIVLVCRLGEQSCSRYCWQSWWCRWRRRRRCLLSIENRRRRQIKLGTRCKFWTTGWPSYLRDLRAISLRWAMLRKQCQPTA